MPPGISFTSQNQKKFNDFNNNIDVSNTLSHGTDSDFCDVNIFFPNGTSRRQKIASNKAVYDILIELSASARLIPTNYTLKLFNDESDNKENDLDAIIEYTPNQKIGQLSNLTSNYTWFWLDHFGPNMKLFSSTLIGSLSLCWFLPDSI